MDLVATYDSDGELPSISTDLPNKIDIIEIDDSDSEVDFSSKQEEIIPPAKISSSLMENNLKETPKTVVKEIECIDLDGSSDTEEEKTEDLTSTPKNYMPTIKVNFDNNNIDSKSVDYLNLNGSDSEDEQLGLEKVNNLLESASVLSDNTCGPEANKDIKIQNDSSIQTAKKPDVKLLSNLKNPLSTQCENKSRIPDSPAVIEKLSFDANINKRFKRDSETPKSTASASNLSAGENEDLNVQSSFMYRKDERISIAYAKNVVCRLPRQISRHYVNHVNIVTALEWCVPQYSHLLLSASSDCTAKVWDMYCRHSVQNFKDILGLKAAKWSLSGEQIVIGGYGKKAHVYDVLSGKEIVSYDVFNHVSSLEIHPYMEDIFLCGTRNAILGFDLRVNSHLPIRTFISKCEEVLNIAFLDENEFVCSTNVVSHDSADRTIMVWDFSTGAIMSNQVYLERYTCPFLKVHPHDSCFIAQTNGDYIAAFSSQKPYKIKDKRYMGHKVSGYGVECDISPDGRYIASGDANGDIYFYNYSNSSLISKLTARPNMATNRLKWHPALNSTIATATWDGHIQIWK